MDYNATTCQVNYFEIYSECRIVIMTGAKLKSGSMYKYKLTLFQLNHYYFVMLRILNYTMVEPVRIHMSVINRIRHC